jgi:hypothetical protein
MMLGERRSPFSRAPGYLPRTMIAQTGLTAEIHAKCELSHSACVADDLAGVQGPPRAGPALEVGWAFTFERAKRRGG